MIIEYDSHDKSRYKDAAITGVQAKQKSDQRFWRYKTFNEEKWKAF